MKKNYRELAKRFEITIFADPDDPNWFCARVPDIPTIFTGGPNPTAALHQAQEAIEGYLTICEEDGLPHLQAETGLYRRDNSAPSPRCPSPLTPARRAPRTLYSRSDQRDTGTGTA